MARNFQAAIDDFFVSGRLLREKESKKARKEEKKKERNNARKTERKEEK